MVYLKTLLVLGCAFVAGCMTSPENAPQSVTVTEDLKFTWRPPIGTPERETTISAGTYVLEKIDFSTFLYSQPDGLVSMSKPGESAQKVKGGIGIDRSNGKIFVWKADISVEMTLLVGPVRTYNKGGQSVYVYFGSIPKPLHSKLIIK